MFTILQGHAVSHSEMQVHPDSSRVSIYTETRRQEGHKVLWLTGELGPDLWRIMTPILICDLPG